MHTGERIKYLRTELLHLTLEELGSILGLGKSALSKLERGENNPTPQLTKSICREFGVREEWLRDGEGEPFGAQSRNQKILAFANKVMSDQDDSFKKRLIDALAELDESEWEVLEKIALHASKKD